MPTFVAAFAGLSLLAMTSAGGPPPKRGAEEYLRLAMGRTFRRSITAVVESGDPGTERGRLTRARTLLDGRGRLRTEVLEPDGSTDVVVFDDGERMFVRIPDRRMVVESESPLRREGAISDRLALVRQNYALELKRGDSAFGRRTVVVLARPRNRGLATRRYVLDAETGYPLRHEATDEGGTRVVFRAVEATFGATLPAGTFDLPAAEGFQRTRVPEAIEYSADAARRRVGFVPIVPKDLPLGFRVREITIKESDDWRSVAFRVSDGLVRASVYTWLTGPRDERLRARAGRLVVRRGGVSTMVVSDEGEFVRAALARAFTGE